MAPNHVSMCQPLLWLEPQRPSVPSRGHRSAKHCRLWARLLASVAPIHFLVGLTLQSRYPSPWTRSRWRGRSESRAEGRRSRCVAAASRATAKPGGGQGGPPLRGCPRPTSPGHPCTPLGHPSRAPLLGTPLGQPSRPSQHTLSAARAKNVPCLSRHARHACHPHPSRLSRLHPSLHSPCTGMPPQTDRQTDRQRNARPKPRTTIVVVWRTDTQLPVPKRRPHTTPPSLHRRAWHAHPDSPTRLRPFLHRRAAC